MALEDIVTEAPYSEHCGLFEFVLDAVMTGLLCLLGFVGNTLSFTVFWKERNNNSASGFLLQAVLIGDMAVLWMLFIGDVIPSLGYVMPMLQDCDTVCGYVSAVTRPLFFLGQICVIWFTLLAIINRYIVMCKPGHASAICTMDFARKQAIITTICAVLLTLPLTLDASVKVTSKDNSTEEDLMLQDNYWYRVVYLNALTLFLVYILPLLGIMYFATRLTIVLQSVKRLRRVLATAYRAQNTDLAQVLLILAITLFLCYLPVATLRALEWADGETLLHCGQLQYYLDCFSKMFQALNSSIKVIIFCLFAKQFRAGLRSHFSIRQDKASPVSVFGMYKCADMSEMTLISNVDRL